MQKIFSTRLDEATLNEMDRVTRKLGLSKREFLEVWAETLGAWQRRESGATTIRQARQTFRRSFGRHHGPADAPVHR